MVTFKKENLDEKKKCKKGLKTNKRLKFWFIPVGMLMVGRRWMEGKEITGLGGGGSEAEKGGMVISDYQNVLLFWI